jgi:hypothetical protein
MAKRLPAGLKTVRSDWANPFWRRPNSAPATRERTPEEKAAYDAIMAKAENHFNRPLEPGERGYKGPVDEPPQQRALSKIVDREARIAVEGDTDSNHDNLEGPK